MLERRRFLLGAAAVTAGLGGNAFAREVLDSNCSRRPTTGEVSCHTSLIKLNHKTVDPTVVERREWSMLCCASMVLAHYEDPFEPEEILNRRFGGRDRLKDFPTEYSQFLQDMTFGWPNDSRRPSLNQTVSGKDVNWIKNRLDDGIPVLIGDNEGMSILVSLDYLPPSEPNRFKSARIYDPLSEGDDHREMDAAEWGQQNFVGVLY